jgi:hypothetical protein
MLARVTRAQRPASESISSAALSAVLGGFEVRDEEVVLDPAPGIGLAGSGPRTAAFAGVDGDGRAVIVVRARRQESVLAAIDALAWCDARGDLLARGLGADAELAPCVALVVDDLDEETLAALSTLREVGLRVFEARTLRSSRGTEHDLAEIERPGSALRADSASTWPERLDEPSRELFDRVRLAMARIDPDVRTAVVGRAIVWRSGAAELVELSGTRGTLEARVRGDHFELGAASDLERLLESAVRALTAASTPADDPRGGTGDATRLGLMPTGPLLSVEEIAALASDASDASDACGASHE